MHTLEPFFNWRHIYTAEQDSLSPFFGREYSEFQFTQRVYNYFIHPQWDEFGSNTMYLKILFTDYERNYTIIELIGEWNDAIENDIMTLKREIIDKLFSLGITRYILIGENVLNFHSGDRDYYEEWFEEVTDENGWIVLINFPSQCKQDFEKRKLHRYIELTEMPQWRTYKPEMIYQQFADIFAKRLD